MNEKIRIDKFLSNQNIGSRKDVGKLIRSGQVAVNGETCKQADAKIDPAEDCVTLTGEPVGYSRYTYIMMNKPGGVLSATRDKGARTVLDLVPPAMQRRGLFPAGRLDKDTKGLLILTDDGDLAHRMLAPKSHVYKLYEAYLEREVTQADINAFREGIRAGENQFLPAQLWCENPEDRRTARVLIREGKFHQVKRMFGVCENEVLSLKRLSIGGLHLDPLLQEGECRKLTFDEMNQVFTVNMHKKQL